MLNYFIPKDFDPSSPAHDLPISRDAIEAEQALDANTPVIFPSGLKVLEHSKVILNGGLLVTMNKSQSLPKRAGDTIIFKWYFGRLNRTAPWSGEIKISIPNALPKTAVAKVIRARVAKPALKVDPVQFEADVAQIEHAIQTLSDTDTMIKAGFCGHSSPLHRTTGVHSLLREAVDSALLEHQKKDEEKARENAKAQDLMSALPDGTPLILRMNEGHSWQLGLKKGRLSASMARHAMIAPSEILRGEDLRAAGLSAHDVLPLDMAAAKAREAFPEAAKFPARPHQLRGHTKLHVGQPFHKSFLTGKRAKEVAAWVGSNPNTGYHGRFTCLTSTPRWREGRFGQDTQNPPRVRKDNHSVVLRERSRYMNTLPDLPRFGRIGGLWCVDEDIVDLMKEHNIGDAHFSPVRVIDIDGKELKKGYHYLSVDTPVHAVMESLCDKSILAFTGGRVIQPYEVIIDQSKVEGIDFWWDDTVRGGTFFFSDRLYKALKKIKGMPHVAPKPCAGV